MKTLISPCLVGIRTRWDEDCEEIEALITLVKSGQAVFLCPEQLGGLTTPREPAEIETGKTAKDVLNGDARVLTNTGKDVTDQFAVGARRILEFCQGFGVEVAILKSGSPSCGSKQTYDGSFTDTKIVGKGITAELLEQNGITVYNEKNFPTGQG
ncbi:MAG TPA: DUF523 domain-containing protein [Anaerolineae bacterium]|jgi:uncharacterized protein YbbK (DUF523 family)|nr:DUF523 domain-containing protein [Anaerolineae bacterium]